MGKGKNDIKQRKNKLNHIRDLIEQEHYKRALYEIINYVNVYPEDTLGHYLYGKLLLRKNELQEARKQFQLVIEHQDEQEVKALMNLATIAKREGDPEEAIRYYQKVIEYSNYTDVYAVNVLARLYRHEQRYQEAIALIDECSYQPELAKEKAKNLSMLGKQEEALIIFNSIDPETELEQREIYLNKGRVAKARDEYDKALFYYESVKDNTEKDSLYYKAIYEEVKLSLAYEKNEEAINYCEELLETNNLFNGEIYLLLGYAYEALSKYTEAYNNYKISAEIAKDKDVRASAYYQLGSIDFAKGNFSLAETAFKRSISNARNISDLTYTKLIGVLFRQEKYNEVLKYVSRIRRYKPESVVDTPLEYIEMLVHKKQNKKLPTRENGTYAEKQIIKYKEKDAIAHIKAHHYGITKTRGNFSPEIDISCLYYEIRNNLKNNDLVNEDAMDIYEIDYSNAGYDLENNLVHKIRVVVFPNTRNILTMYPGCRATVPKRGYFKNEKARQKTKKQKSVK